MLDSRGRFNCASTWILGALSGVAITLEEEKFVLIAKLKARSLVLGLKLLPVLCSDANN